MLTEDAKEALDELAGRLMCEGYNRQSADDIACKMLSDKYNYKELKEYAESAKLY